MKSILGIVLLSLCTPVLSVWAQIPPQVKISGTPTNTVSVQWNSQIGTNYELILTDHLDTFSLWQPADAPVTAASTNTTMVVANGGSNAFFKVHVLNDFSGLPTCKILSLTNNQVVSGTIIVPVSAQDDRRLSAVNFYMDGNLLTSIGEGSLNFTLDTTHFANGPHIITACALDNEGIPYLGGSANNLIVANEMCSSPVTLVFNNPVRWPDAPVLLGDYMEINVESDIFPADWTVVVEDETGSTVQTISGFTADGIIQTIWDGLDANGNPVPDEHDYTVTVFVTEAPSASQSSLLLGIANEVEKSVTKINQYGMVDCAIEDAAQMPSEYDYTYTMIYNEWMARPDKDEYPPLPPPTPVMTEQKTKKKLPLSEILKKKTDSASTGPIPSAAGGSGSVKTVPWKETPWSSGQILLARQKYSSGLAGFAFNATIATMLNNVSTLVEAATTEVGNHRSVVDNTVFVSPDSGSYSSLLGKLQATSTRAFYYHGHSNGKAVGYSEFTPNEGLTDNQLQLSLNNLHLPAQNGLPARYRFRHPFRFVFIDGCLSANGGLPEAFGIAKNTGTNYHPNYKRAYMGWASTTQNSIANNDFQLWTQKFWVSWLDDAANYDRSLSQALDIANTTYPNITNSAPLVVYGSKSLTWRK